MDLKLENKRVLVTGASAGLGAAVAEALVAEGADVMINSRDQGRINASADRIKEKTGKKPSVVAADIATESGRKTVVDAINDKWGEKGIDVFISNTGGPPPGASLDHSAETWDEAGKLLVDSAVGLTRAFLPGMMKRKWGRLIYITSVAVLQPVDTLILSNSYRAAVTGFCKTVSNTYGMHGVTANCVCPGYTATERLQSLAENLAGQSGRTADDVMSDFAAQTASGRVGQPDELAALIAFLASEKAAYITGASIPVDGGCHKGLL